MNAHNRWDIEYFFARPQDAGRQGDFGEWDVVEWKDNKHDEQNRKQHEGSLHLHHQQVAQADLRRVVHNILHIPHTISIRHSQHRAEITRTSLYCR